MIDLNDKSFRGAVELSATSTTLLRGLRQDDPAAWEQLMAKYMYAVYRWARKARLSPHDAQDVTQEVFRSAVQSLPNFHESLPSATFRGWLRRITQRRIADRLREIHRQPGGLGGGLEQIERLLPAPLPPAGDSSRVPGPQQHVGEAVQAVRRRCKEQNWEMFAQMIYDERSPEEVAEAFGVPCSHVYNIKSRYLRRLRTELTRRGFPGRQAT